MKLTSKVSLFLLATLIFLSGCATSVENKSENKPAILIAAFGSSYETGQKNLEDFDTAVREAFPDREVYWGLTASFIVKKLKKAGTETLFERETPLMAIADAYEYMKSEGIKDVLTVNFLLMVGGEYREVLNTPTNGMNVKYVHPLLYYPENIQNAVTALESEFGNPEDTATIFCAHGNAKNLEYNAELIQVDQYLRANYDNTYLAVMEGTPEFSKVREEIKASGVKNVRFISFMLTYGDHMSNDVFGDEEDSMKTQLGLEATITDGLASNNEFQNVYIDAMKSVMKQF